MSSNIQSIKWRAAPIGGDGYFTLLLSNIILVATAALIWCWLAYYVLKTAKKTASFVAQCDVITVLGMRLDNDQVNADYTARLTRAQTLFEAGVANKILLVGGHTGDNRISEAEGGLRFLLQQGIPAAYILLEDSSRHTLENLSNARQLYLGKQNKKTSLITNRFHLARSHIMAKGLKLTHVLCAAEDQFQLTLKNAYRIAVEAYFIHWYLIGKLWAHCIRSEKSLNRIT